MSQHYRRHKWPHVPLLSLAVPFVRPPSLSIFDLKLSSQVFIKNFVIMEFINVFFSILCSNAQSEASESPFLENFDGHSFMSSFMLGIG